MSDANIATEQRDFAIFIKISAKKKASWLNWQKTSSMAELLKKSYWKFKFDWSYLWTYYQIFFIIIGLIIKKLV